MSPILAAAKQEGMHAIYCADSNGKLHQVVAIMLASLLPLAETMLLV